MALTTISLLLISYDFLVAQVFIPMAFWKNTTATLSISDANTYNFGTLNTSASADKTFVVTNSGNGIASNITGQSFASGAFTFKGGSFPGTGGTCAAGLAAGQSCTMVVTASSSTVGTASSPVTISYRNITTASVTAVRPMLATFANTATRLAWVSTPSFIKLNTCTAVTIQRQDDAGNGVVTGVATNITNLLFNNGVTGTYYTSATCVTTTTTATIAAAANSVTVYFRNTTANQNGILVATAAGLTSASQNVTITAAPTKLYLSASPTMKTNTCTEAIVYSVDANNFPSSVAANTTVSLTTTGANTYYSDSGCGVSATTTTILASTSSRTVYTINATVQANTLTAAATGLTSSNRSVNFNTSLSWWDADWTRRIRIEINNTDQAAAFTNQPVLVKLNSSVVNYSDILATGADVRFVDSDDVTVLNHEFDLWQSGSTSEIWVRIPNIPASSSADYFYMYYKNPSATDGQNRTGVWTNYWSVWHLGEDPTAAAPQYYDSTGNGRNGTAVNSGRSLGSIGYAVSLTTTTDAVDINSDLSAGLGASSTLSAWVLTSQVGNNTMWQAPGLTGVEQSGGGNDIFFGWIDATGYIGVTAGNGANAKSNFIVNNNAWRHVTISRNSGTGAVVFYINGVANGSAASETGNKTTYFDLFGEIGDTGGSPVNYNGHLDEIRIRTSVASADQIKADFKFMVNTHLTYGSVETGP